MWKDVLISCPYCKKVQKIEIPESVVLKHPITCTVHIEEYRICDHAFDVFVDKNFDVRGYQVIDYKPRKKRVLEIKISESDIDLFLIIINIEIDTLIFVINNLLRKKKVLMIIEDNLNYIKKTLLNFFKFIFYNSFNINVNVLTKREFKYKRGYYSDYSIIECNNVIKSKMGDRGFIPLRFEREIVESLYRERDILELRKTIYQSYSLAKKILEFHKQHDGIIMSRKEVIKHLKNNHYIKIKQDYFNLLKEIARDYFDANIIYTVDVIIEKIQAGWRENGQ